VIVCDDAMIGNDDEPEQATKREDKTGKI